MPAAVRVLARVYLALLAGGGTLILLVAFAPWLAPTTLVGISIGTGIAVGLVGPKLFELLLAFF